MERHSNSREGSSVLPSAKAKPTSVAGLRALVLRVRWCDDPLTSQTTRKVRFCKHVATQIPYTDQTSVLYLPGYSWVEQKI